MPGIIQDQMPPDQAAMPPQAPGPQQAPGGADVTPEAVRAGLHLPPQLQDAYDRVVTAGMKVMFDKQTHGQMLALMQQPGPLEQKIGMGVAGLLLMLFQQSNKTLPPAVMIPAGVTLVAHAVQFLKQSGQDVPPEVVAEGVSIMITTLLKKFGVDPDKVMAQGAQGAAAAGAPAAPPQAPQPAPAAPDEQEPAPQEM